MSKKHKVDEVTREDCQLLTHEEVAQLLRVTSGTLYNWRYLKKGPPWFMMGAEPRYRLEDVRAWQEANLVRHDPVQ
jgi:hypothetical protein